MKKFLKKIFFFGILIKIAGTIVFYPTLAEGKISHAPPEAASGKSGLVTR